MLVVAIFLVSESFVITGDHAGQFTMFLQTPKTNVILRSAAFYINMNGKVFYP